MSQAILQIPQPVFHNPSSKIETLQKQLFRGLMLSSLAIATVLGCFYGVMVLLKIEDPTVEFAKPLIFSIALAIMFGAGLFSLRQGFYFPTALVMVWGLFISSFVIIQTLNFGFYSPIKHTFFVTIILSGFLLGPKNLRAITAGSIISVLWFYSQEALGWKETLFPAPRLDFVILIILLMLITAYAVDRMLVGLIEQNKEIEQNQDQLEIEVRERTSQLEKALNKANQANMSKDVFLATMSHELRTPLNAIIGYAEMTQEELKEGVISDDTIRDVDHIRASSKHLLHIINMVLNLSKVEAGEEDALFESVSVGDVIEDVIQFSKALVDKSNNQFQVNLTVSDQFEVWVDRQKLMQILLNLISNALKFTEGGLVELAVSVEESERFAEFVVLDTGIGIPEEMLYKLFEPFQQLENSFSRRYQGTGLGLSICKRYCELMGAEITAKNRPEGGASFTVRVQVKNERLKRATGFYKQFEEV